MPQTELSQLPEEEIANLTDDELNEMLLDAGFGPIEYLEEPVEETC